MLRLVMARAANIHDAAAATPKRAPESQVAVHNTGKHLVTTAVADDDEHRALVQLDAILHQRAYALVHFLAHDGRPPRAGEEVKEVAKLPVQPQQAL